MKKYIDISNKIKDQFKTGIQILDDVSNDIQEFLTLLQSSSGETIELIRNDLTFLKDKYTTIKEKVEKRSSEIEERANTYDACLEQYIEKKGEKIRDFGVKKDSQGCVCEYKTETLNEILGPDDSSDGIGYYNHIIREYTVSDTGPICNGSYSTDYKKIDEMANFQGGFWNASDYVMNSIALGVSQLSKVAPSTNNNSGTGNVNYTNALSGTLTGAMAGIGVEIFDDQNTLTIGDNQNDKDFADSQDDEELTDNQDALSTDGNQDNEELADTQDISLTDDNQDDKAPTDTQDSLSTESDGPIEYNTQERMDAAISDIKEHFNSADGCVYCPIDMKRWLEVDGYTEQEILYALYNAGIDWKESALEWGHLYINDGYDIFQTRMLGLGFKQSEIDYAFKELKIK